MRLLESELTPPVNVGSPCRSASLCPGTKNKTHANERNDSEKGDEKAPKDGDADQRVGFLCDLALVVCREPLLVCLDPDPPRACRVVK